jgi:hypothetical protein
MGLLNLLFPVACYEDRYSKIRPCRQAVGDQKRIEIFPGVFKKLVQSCPEQVEGRAAATGTGGGAYE